MTYNVVDPATGAVIGTLTLNAVPTPAPAPTPTPAPVPPGTIVIPWGPTLFSQWYDVTGAELKVFQFTIGKKGAVQQSITFSNASATNKLDFSVSHKPGDFSVDPTLNSANVRLGSYGSVVPFSTMNLQLGQTYFINIRNSKSTSPDEKFRLDMNQ